MSTPIKITKTALKIIIKEEYYRFLNEAATCHDSSGFFADCKAGNVYSLTRKGAKSAGISDKYVQRGTVSQKKSEAGEPPRISSKYGLNTSKDKSGGRKTIDGDDISPKFKVKDYPEQYDEVNDLMPSTDDAESDMEMDFQLSVQDIVDIVKQVLRCPGSSSNNQTRLEQNNKMSDACERAGYIKIAVAQARVLRGVSNAVRATKGEIGINKD